LIESRGDICISSPKCHPELAGNGVEYGWGIWKKRFRQINDQQFKNLIPNIKTALEVVTIDVSWRFQRKARTYRRVYAKTLEPRCSDSSSTSGDPSGDYESIELMTKRYKTHRNIAEIERKYIAVVLEESSRNQGSQTMHLDD
jgi:hypothetical protein